MRPGQEAHSGLRRRTADLGRWHPAAGFEAMLWLRKGFGFADAWTVREQNQLLAYCFGLPAANKA